jgi:hypothetical protein
LLKKKEIFNRIVRENTIIAFLSLDAAAAAALFVMSPSPGLAQVPAVPVIHVPDW